MPSPFPFLRRRWIRIIQFLRFVELPLPGLAALGMVSLLAAVLDGVGIGLLVPLLKGVIESDLAMVTDSVVFGWFTHLFVSEWWQRPTVILASLVLLACGAAIAHQVFEYWAAIMTSRLTRASADKLRRRIFGLYLTMGQTFFDLRNFGELQTVIVDYTHDIGETCLYLRDVITRAMIVIIYVGLMLALSWQLSLILFALAPIYHFGVTALIRRIKTASPRYSEAKRDLNAVVHRVLPRLPLIRSSSMLAVEMQNFSLRSNELRWQENQMDAKLQLVTPLQRIFLNLLLLVLVFVIYGLLQRNWIGVSAVLVYFFLVREVVTSMGVFSFFRANISRIDGHISAIRELEQAHPQFRVRGGTTPFKGLHDAIHFRKLDFHYEGHPDVLQKISFSVRQGQRTAIVGPSGSGKSTLIQLLLRHYPCPRNRVFFDETDINDLELGSLASQISWVSQNIQLFNDTLHHNLTYGLPEVDDHTLEKLIAQTKLTDVVSRLPHGLQTRIGDDGIRLSGGERQRVSIARALLKDAPILILDEATNAMDTQLENEIRETIETLAKGRTVLVITHQLSSLQRVDHIVMVEAGHLVEQGAPSALRTSGGRFQQLWDEQRLELD